LSRFIDQFVERAAAASDLEGTVYTKKMCVDFSEKKFCVLENIFIDFKHYMSSVQSQICDKTPGEIEQLGE